ncbi:hypothetical protein OAG24_00630 [bacterium]|nr:hypothetical protein [bacterium]
MNSEINEILEQELKKQSQKEHRDNFLQNAIRKAEDETNFILTGEVNIVTEAEKEIKELNDKIAKLKSESRRQKNVRNHRKTNVNRTRKARRDKIKKEIAECNLRIAEINEEFDESKNQV